MNAALVPIKSLAASKSRLGVVLGRDQLARLGLAMMEDVVGALLEVEALDRVVVATPDADAARAAEALGAEAFLGEDAGLNPALDAACRRLLVQDVRSVTTVLGDVAGAEPDDFARLLAETIALAKEARGRAVGLAASDDGGTAALVRVPPDVIRSRFGHHSAELHRSECKTFDIRLCELDLPSLHLDLDEVEDVKAFLASTGGGARGARTRAVLEAAGWDELVRRRGEGSV